jgi:GNAT superfamily N-acetyltransferase
MNQIEIRRARITEADAVLDLWREARRWLAAAGTDQWQPHRGETDVSLTARVRANVAHTIETGDCYIAIHKGVIVGTITVDERADPEFWRPGDNPPAALYVHRMIVRRGFAGQGIGKILLDWADKLASARGRWLLRLDAWQSNKALHRYYESQGFSQVRILRFEHRGSGALFQRPVTTLDAGAEADATFRRGQ